jgi:uncharacterized protein YraI
VHIAKRVTPALTICAAAGWLTVTAAPAHATVVPTHQALTCAYQLTNLRAGGYLNVRSAPALNSRRVGTLKVSDGRFAGGCTSTRGWVAVKSSNGRSGWASGHYLRKTTKTRLAAPTSRPWGCTYQLTHVQPTSTITVYNGRNTSYQRVGTLSPADGRFGGGCTATEGWVPVTSSNGRPGWVSSYYLQRVS